MNTSSQSPETFFEPLRSARRIVIKLGTQVVMDASGASLDRGRLVRIVEQCGRLVQAGREVIVVTSGAVGLGRQKLGLGNSLSLSEKQVCAAVGQSLLMDGYRELFDLFGVVTAQVLLTANDFADRKHYLNLQQTLEKALNLKVVPIINENDTVSTMELQDEGYVKGFGDNDKLSALVASKLDADLLVILTNVDGIYTDNPETNPQAALIPVIERFEDLQQVDARGRSGLGRGGMASKLEAARIAAISGLHTYIASGLKEQPLRPLLENCRPAGTLILPQASLNGRKRWIGLASGYYGIIIINENARKALVQKQVSLLPVGIVGVEGDFAAQQVVSIQDEQGREVGRGLSHFSSEELERIKGVRGSEIAALLPGCPPERPEAVHRDNLVIFQEYGV